MSDLKCPHCYSNASRGASVCQGCGAEIKYGAPSVIYFFIVAIGVYFGSLTYAIAPAGLAFLGWVAGIGSSLAALQLSNRIFKSRVKFTRYYRHYRS